MDRARLVSEVETLLGRPWESLDPRVSIAVELDPGARGWVLRVRAGGQGERELLGEACAPLAQAGALLVAWILEPPVAGGSEGAPDDVPGSDAPPPLGEGARSLAGPGPVLASRIAPRSRPGWSLGDPAVAAPARGPVLSVGLGAAFVLDLASLPTVAPGVVADVVVRIDHLDLRARAGWLAPQAALLANSAAPEGAGVEVAWAGGSLHACGRPFDPAGPGLAFCGGIHAGAWLAQGLGVSHPRRAEIPTAAVGLGVAMPWAPLPELDLELGAELLVPLGTPSFELGIAGMSEVAFTPAPVSGRLTLAGHIDVR
jgi:hypothetical protein